MKVLSSFPYTRPVYAAILAALARVAARFQSLPYAAQFAAVLAGMLVATGVPFMAVLSLAPLARREFRESGRPMARGHAPLWGLPLILAAIMAASAGAA